MDQSGRRVGLEVDDRRRENARIRIPRPHRFAARGQEPPVFVRAPHAPLASIGRLADEEPVAKGRESGDGLLHAPSPEPVVPYQRPVLTELEHGFDRLRRRCAEELRQAQEVAVHTLPEMEAQQHVLHPEIADRLDQGADRRRIRTHRDAQALEGHPFRNPFEPAAEALALDDRPEQRPRAAKQRAGMVGGVAQSDTEALAARRLLMRLVRERIPDGPLLGLRSAVRLRYVGMGAAARQQEIGKAAQPPAGAFLRSDLETETVVKDLEQEPLIAGQPP